MGDEKKPTAFSLAKSREQTPPVSGLGAFGEAVKFAISDAIDLGDVAQIVKKQVEKAKAGDSAAAKTVIGFALAAGRASAPEPKPIRLEPAEPDPPKPVALPRPGLEQHRKLVALYLIQHQFATVGELGRLTGIEGDALDALLNCDWFAVKSGRVQITAAGRQQVG